MMPPWIHPQHRDGLRRALWLLGGLALGLLVVAVMPVPQALRGIGGYEPLHTLLETIAVIVAVMVFAITWHAWRRDMPRNVMLLACGFLGVALLDFSHTLSFAGMPAYVTPSNPEKAINFWLAARLLAAVSLLAAAALPWKPLARPGSRHLVLLAVLALTALLHVLFLFAPQAMPRTFVAGTGLTPLKIATEWLLVALGLASAVLMLLRMREPQPFNAVALFLVAATTALSEVLFTLYANVSDLYNLVGHLYKVVAYGFLYRAIFVEALATPYRQLSEARTKLQAIFSTLPDPLWLKDSDGVFLDCNPAYERLYDVPREHIVGTRGEAFLDQALAEQFRSLDADVLQRGQARVDELWFETKRGRLLFDVVRMPLRDHRAEVIGVMGVARDISAARQGQEALRNSEQRLQQAVRAGHIGIFDHDHLADTLHWSDELRGHYDVPADVPASLQTFVARLHPDDLQRVRSAVLRAHDPSGDGLFDLEHRVVRRDGSVRTLRTRAQTEFGGQGLARRKVRTIGAVQDVTDEKRTAADLQRLNATLEARVQARTSELEAAMSGLRLAQDELVRNEKMASLGSLVAGVAHELNTPIGNAVMMASTLSGRQLEFEAGMQEGLRRSALQGFLRDTREVSDVLERNLQRAAQLIGGFKQIAVDQSSYQRRPFELSEVVHEIGLTLRPSLRRHGVTLEDRIPPGLMLDSYPGPLGQVLINLVNNAIVHAFEGRDTGLVRIVAEDIDAERLRLVVSDDGCGIAREHLRQIFDPFFTTRLGQGGSGLGLHIVYTLVTGLLGGRIVARSEPGQGAAFHIELPRVAPGTAAPGPALH